MSTYFFDNCLSKNIVEALRALGDQEVTHLQLDGFKPDVKDVDWMPVIGLRGWIGVTVDHNIKKRPDEAKARRDAGLRTVWLHKSVTQMLLWDQAAYVIKYWQRIRKHTERCHEGDCFLVGKEGEIEKLDLR